MSELAKPKKLMDLLLAVDELAVAQDKFDKGEIKYKDLAGVTDKVLAVKKKIDPGDRIKIERKGPEHEPSDGSINVESKSRTVDKPKPKSREKEAETPKAQGSHTKGKRGGNYVIINGRKIYAKTLARIAAKAAKKRK